MHQVLSYVVFHSIMAIFHSYRPTQLSLDYVQELLAFDDYAEVCAFLQSLDIPVPRGSPAMLEMKIVFDAMNAVS